MRKVTNILLLISEILCFVAIAVFLILGIVFLSSAGIINNDPNAFLIELRKQIPNATMEMVNAYAAMFLVWGIIFLVAGVFSIPAGILCVHCRRKLKHGTTKHEMKAKAICLIVLGVLSVELPIVPAIMMLAMGEENFKA